MVRRENTPLGRSSTLVFRAVIAESFGDIFRNNLTKNGQLPVLLTKPQIDRLTVDAKAGKEITVDLENQVVITADGSEKFPSRHPSLHVSA